MNTASDQQLVKQARKPYAFTRRNDSANNTGGDPGGYSPSSPYPAQQPQTADDTGMVKGGPDAPSSDESELDRLRKERLAAALKAIGADFNFQEGDLKGQLDELKNLFSSETKKNDRNEKYAQEAILDNSVERGIFNSGITLKNVARGLTPFQEQRAQIIGSLNPTKGAEGTDIRNIMSAIALLSQQKTGAEASAKLDSKQEKLDIATLLEMLKAGLGG